MADEVKDDFLIKRQELISRLQEKKYDLTALMFKHESIIKVYQVKHNNEIKDNYLNLFSRTNHASSDIEDLMHTMKHAILAPSYHYNNYILALIRELSVKQEDNEELLFCIYQIEVASIIISFKIGLDRMVSLFSYYYKGINPEGVTFGHYNSNTNKFEGFMSIVNQNKEKDELSKYIYNEYFSWIKKVVEPRDTIIHYNGLGIYKEYDMNYQSVIPIHYNERLFKDLEVSEYSENRFNYSSLKEYVNKWISFTETVFSLMLNQQIKENPKRIQYPNSK